MTNNDAIELTKKGKLQVVENEVAGVVWQTGISGSEIWMGDLNVEPNIKTEPLHHGASETVHYVLKGAVTIHYGDKFSTREKLEEGDFIYIPPYRAYTVNNEDTANGVRIVTFMASEFVVNYINETEIVAIPEEFLEDDFEIKRGQDLDAGTDQTKNMPRKTGIQSSKIWIGRVTGEPAKDSGAHHHGKAETGGFIISGVTRLLHGENYKEYVELTEGDFLRVPPFLPHIERNMSDTETVEFLTARNPRNIVVNLD